MILIFHDLVSMNVETVCWSLLWPSISHCKVAIKLSESQGLWVYPKFIFAVETVPTYACSVDSGFLVTRLFVRVRVLPPQVVLLQRELRDGRMA